MHASGLPARGAVAVLLSLGVNLLALWLVLAADVVPPFEPLSWVSVGLLSAMGAVGATVAYAVVSRLSDRPRRTFSIVAAVALVASFGPTALLAGAPGATTGAIAVLMAMHVPVAAIAVAVLAPRTTDRPSD